SLAKVSAKRFITSATRLSASSTARRGSSTKPVWISVQRLRKFSVSSFVKSANGGCSRSLPGIVPAGCLISCGVSTCCCALAARAISAVLKRSSRVSGNVVGAFVRSFMIVQPPFPVAHWLLIPANPQTARDNVLTPGANLLLSRAPADLRAQCRAPHDNLSQHWDDLPRCRRRAVQNRLSGSHAPPSRLSPSDLLPLRRRMDYLQIALVHLSIAAQNDPAHLVPTG